MQRIVLASLALAPLVAAHGFMNSIVIDGKLYTGPQPGTGKAGNGSVIRRIDTIDPMKGTDNPNLACGSNAQNAALQADALPGSNISVSWMGGGGQLWPHEIGPVMTYLAECTGTPDCTTFDASSAQWFKIDQMGLQDAQKGVWWHNEFKEGRPLNLTLPSSLTPGNYLLRNEIVALHIATSVGGVEFYPACAQIRVGSNNQDENTPPSLTPNGTVSFPGAYAATDASIFTPDIFNTPVQYVFPGGAVSNVRSDTDEAHGADLDAAFTPAASGVQQVAGGDESTTTSGSNSNSTSTGASQGQSQNQGQGQNNGTASTQSTSGKCKSKRRVHARSWRIESDYLSPLRRL